MLTEEQKKAAERALYLRLPMFQNFEKEIAFENHKTAIEWIDKYNLPYRISLDYLKQYDHNKGFIHINPNYPYPGYKKADLVHVSPDNITLFDDLKMIASEESTRQQIEDHNKKLRPWDLSTAEGLSKWKYYFAHLLNAAQLNEYSDFDWWGKKNAPKEEQEKNQQKINFWKCLQYDYCTKPDNYMNEEPRAADYDLEEYTQLEFIVDWDNKKSTQYSNSMM